MNTKQSSLSNSEVHISQIHIKTEMKRLINKNPCIYEGNLRYRIRETFPKISYTDVTLILMDLIEENYFINHYNAIYPPEQANFKEKQILEFAYWNNLDDMSIGILLCIDEMGANANQLSEISRYFISRYTDYDEKDAKLRIGQLTINGMLISIDICGQVYLKPNWKIIQGVLK